MKQTSIFRPLIQVCALLFVFAGCDGGPLTNEDAGGADASAQEQDTEVGDGESEDVGDPEDTGSDNPDTGDGGSEDSDTDEGAPDSGDTGDDSEPELGTDHYQDVPKILIFPLRSEVQYSYERSWHECRPSENSCDRAHRAIQIYADAQTPVFACADGQIAWRNTDISTDSGGGYQLHIDSENPDLRLVYAHLGSNTKHRAFRAFAQNPSTGKLWDVGDSVSAGDHIGYVGDSGSASSPQVQLEIRSRIPNSPLETDKEAERSYGDSSATPGTFNYLRFDPWNTLQASEGMDSVPDASSFEPVPDPEFDTEYYRDVPRLFMFPLKQSDDYEYERRWYDCRPSATNCTRAHRAVDIYDEPGTEIYAGANGQIAWRNTDINIGSGGGYQLHIDPSGNPNLRITYSHFGPDQQGAASQAFAENPRTGNLWNVGDTVYEGELLGWLGTSGATASGPHLHFEVRSRIPGLPEEETTGSIDYGDHGATPGTFGYLRFDSWDTLQLAEDLEIYPK